MPAVVRASLEVLVSWSAYNVGLFSIGFSTIGGTDTFGVSPSDVTFGGTYDDVSALCRGYRIRRGRDSRRDFMLAGTATVPIDDPAKIFNVANPLSPLAGQLDDRLHPIRIRQRYGGVWYPRFYGWTRAPIYKPGQRKGRVVLNCVDLFYWLERTNPIIAATGVTTTGAAIGLILDQVKWIDPTARSLATGDTIPDFSADGSRSAKDLIADLLEPEGGVFFINGSGVAVYRDRLARLQMTSVATIQNTMRELEAGSDFDDRYNRVQITREQDGITYTAVDQAAVNKNGYVDLPISTRYMTDGPSAQSRANWILQQEKEPRPPIYAMAIDNREDALMQQLLTRELVDRITVIEAQGGTNGEYHIDAIDETLDERGGHSVSWQLSKTSSVRPFTIGTSAIASPDVFV